MNNTFSFNRFKDLLLKDGKMYFRNYGTSVHRNGCGVRNIHTAAVGIAGLGNFVSAR